MAHTWVKGKNCYCTECKLKESARNRRRYRQEPGNGKERSREAQRKHRVKRKALLDGIKLWSGCVDCGYRSHPGSLQFDHIDPDTKSRRVSECGGFHRLSLAALLAELDKCVVRCGNCHAERTHREGHSQHRFD